MGNTGRRRAPQPPINRETKPPIQKTQFYKELNLKNCVHEECENEDCVICFEKLCNNSNNCVKTKCGHKFHQRCIIEWVKRADNQF